MTSIRHAQQKINAKIFLVALFFLAACGNRGHKSDVITNQGPRIDHQKEPVIQMAETDDGRYQVRLLPLNEQFAGDPSGVFQVIIKGDSFEVDGEMRRMHHGVRHFQFIHAGVRCPDEGDDKNGDFILDGFETLAASGPVVLPLDSNISSQFEGLSYGPLANEEGTYFYRRTTSFASLMADLFALDHDLSDRMVKLAPNEKLRLQDKVMVVYGVDANTHLPESASALDELGPREAFPVACGRFVRID